MSAPFVDDGDLRIYVGDALEVLRSLPDGCVDCCVTSPPYWGLRNYGTEGQLGLEASPAEYVAAMVVVFGEVRRVLADHGTLWLNLGSSYFSDPGKGGSGPNGKNESRWSYGRAARPDAQPSDTSCIEPQDSPDLGSACRDLCDEHLAAFLSHRDRIADTPRPPALAAQPLATTGRGNEPAGSEQASPDASPLDVQESTTLRSWLQQRGPCSRCDERASALSDVRSSSPDAPASARNSWLNYTRKLKPKDLVPIPWMVGMALQEDGWYLRCDVIWSKANPMPESVTDRPTKSHEYVLQLSKGPRYFFDQEAVRERYADPEDAARYRVTGDVPGQTPHGATRGAGPDGRRVTAVVSKDGSEQHRNGERWPNPTGRNVRSVWTIATQPYADAHFATFPEELPRRCILAGCPEGGTVLDPFGGSGTTGLVARKHGRRAVLIELNPEYARLAATRCQQLSLLAEPAA